MVKHSLTLGPHFFERKKDAQDYIIRILDRYVDQSLSGEALEVVLALLERHPDYDEKVGLGIQRIFVRQAPSTYGLNIKPKRCFYIKRVDGTEVEFSYKKCLHGGGSDQRHERLIEERRQSAYRSAVDGQVIAFKQQQHQGCAACGCIGQTDFHVDHVTQFADLVRQFEQHEPELPSQFDEDPVYHKKQFRVEDEKYEERWQQFHDQHAELRILCSQCNLRRKRGSRSP